MCEKYSVMFCVLSVIFMMFGLNMLVVLWIGWVVVVIVYVGCVVRCDVMLCMSMGLISGLLFCMLMIMVLLC